MGMKRVLFVSDYFTNGGLETRILDLVDFYRRHGIESFLVCDTLEPEHEKKFVQILRLPLRTLDFKTIIHNTDKLVTFCRDSGVEMIDCQPLYGFIPAVLASSIQHIPMSYTSHSIFALPSIADSSSPLFYSLLELKRPQIFVVGDYLLDVHKGKFMGCRTDVARNGMSLSNLPKLKSGHGNRWAYAARLSPEKTKPLLDSLPIIEQSGIVELDVFGDGESRNLIEQYIAEHTESKLKINLRGWYPDLQNQLATGGYSGFFGTDRAAMEAMAIGLPVIILGLHGLGPAVSEASFNDLLYLNMSSDQNVDQERALYEIADIRTNPEKYKVQSLVKKHLDAEQLWKEYFKKTESIPVDLGRDSMVEFWWDKFYKSVLLEQTVSSQEEQLNRLTQELEESHFHKVAKMLRSVTKKRS